MSAWTPGMVIIASKNGPESIAARISGPFAAHRTPMNFSVAVAGEEWTLTHIPSGRRICTLPAEEFAAEAVSALLPLADWTTRNEDAFRSVEIKKAVIILAKNLREKWLLGEA